MKVAYLITIVLSLVFAFLFGCRGAVPNLSESPTPYASENPTPIPSESPAPSETPAQVVAVSRLSALGGNGGLYQFSVGYYEEIEYEIFPFNASDFELIVENDHPEVVDAYPDAASLARPRGSICFGKHRIGLGCRSRSG